MGMARRLQAGHARWHNVQFGTQSDEFVFFYFLFYLSRMNLFFFLANLFFFLFLLSLANLFIF